MPEENIRTLSRSTKVLSEYKVVKKDGESGNTHFYSNIYEAVGAGCLQRIADSLEKLEKLTEPTQALENRIKILEAQLAGVPTNYELQKKVTKLSARLKKAGLDADPDSDRRGRPKG